MHPAVAVGQERPAIHQDRTGLRQPGPQAVQDGEPVGVDVAPVDDVDAGEPGQPAHPVHIEALAPDHDSVRRHGHAEIGDLVLDHERGARDDGELEPAPRPAPPAR